MPISDVELIKLFLRGARPQRTRLVHLLLENRLEREAVLALESDPEIEAILQRRPRAPRLPAAALSHIRSSFARLLTRLGYLAQALPLLDDRPSGFFKVACGDIGAGLEDFKRAHLDEPENPLHTGSYLHALAYAGEPEHAARELARLRHEGRVPELSHWLLLREEIGRAHV